jgi:hypothetical protein
MPAHARHGRASTVVAAAACCAALVVCHGCADPERDRLKATTKATYDKATGKLTELTYDANKNGRIDTWTEMDGTRPVRSRIDSNEDGRVDRWEYYDAAGKLSKVGFSRTSGDAPDAWAFAGPGGGIERIEISSAADPARIDRWEFYDASGKAAVSTPDNPGTPLRVEEDTNGDGRADKWERYQGDVVSTVEFDENHDGRPDRRLTYKDTELALIETAPDASGRYQKQVAPK